MSAFSAALDERCAAAAPFSSWSNCGLGPVLQASDLVPLIHNFGRTEQVDRDTLARLVSSISRFLTPEQAAAAAVGAEVDIVDSRPLGGAWTLDRLWERLGIGAAIRRVATGRRLDGEAVELDVFAWSRNGL